MQIFCIGFIFLIPVRSFSQVQIDSVKTTVSTCAQNGSITIFAKSPSNPFLVYTITAGNPDSLITQGIPNDTSTIVTYTLQVTNVSGCKVSLQKIVAIDSASSTACMVKPTNAFTPNGKNENDLSKSIRLEDFIFLKQFQILRLGIEQ